MKLKVNDQIMVIAGKHKGKTGKILRTFEETNKIIVEKVNMQTDYKKKSQNAPGQKVQKEGAIDASNIMILDPKTKKPTRIGYRFLPSGKKERFAKKSGISL